MAEYFAYLIFVYMNYFVLSAEFELLKSKWYDHHYPSLSLSLSRFDLFRLLHMHDRVREYELKLNQYERLDHTSVEVDMV